MRHFLRGASDIEIVGEASNGTDAVEMLRALSPQLAFLDVELPDFDGFEILRQLEEKQRPAVIYITAHDDRALQAFDVQALDYLVKPFDSERLARAIEHARRHLLPHSGVSQIATPYLKALAIRDRGRIEVVQVGAIDYIDVAGHYLCVHVGRTVHLIRGSLSELELRLDPMQFARIHRSSIVRIDRVKTLKARRNGDHDVMLANGTKLLLSRTYSALLRRRLRLFAE